MRALLRRGAPIRTALRSALKGLQRHTTSGHWIPEIDGLRFVAIAAVVLYHMRGELMHNGYHPIQPQFSGMVHALDLGRRGVQIFFVISGFILTRPFAAHFLRGDPLPSLRRYFLRRVTRLEPPYIVNLLVSAVLLQLAWHPGWKEVGRHLTASFAYLDSLLVYRHGGLPISGVAWSLEIEIQFYLIAPLLARLIFSLRSPWLRRGLLLALMPAAAALQHGARLGPNHLFWYIQYFFAGMLLADVDLLTLAHTRHTLWWDVAGLGWLAVFWIPGSEAYWLAPLAAVLCAGALHGRALRSVFRVPLLAMIGGMCYTIYLWHPIAMSIAQRLLSRVDTYLPLNYGLYFLIQGIVKIVFIALISLPAFLLIERPCMDPRWPAKLAAFLRAFRHPAQPQGTRDTAPDLVA